MIKYEDVKPSITRQNDSNQTTETHTLHTDPLAPVPSIWNDQPETSQYNNRTSALQES